MQVSLYAYTSLILGTLSIMDIRTRSVPNYLTLGAYPVFLVFILGDAVAHHNHSGYQHLLDALVGAVLLTTFFGTSFWINSQSIGIGDLKIAPLFGAILAWKSWSAFGLGLATCFLANGIYALILILTHKANRKSHIALIPFMFLGFVIASV